MTRYDMTQYDMNDTSSACIFLNKQRIADGCQPFYARNQLKAHVVLVDLGADFNNSPTSSVRGCETDSGTQQYSMCYMSKATIHCA